MKKFKWCSLLVICLYFGTTFQMACAQSAMPSPVRTVAIEKWEAMKFGMFIHFGMNTYVNGSDYDDSKSPAVTYNPIKLRHSVIYRPLLFF